MIKGLDLNKLKNGRGTVSTYIKASSDPETAPQIRDYSKSVVDAQPILGVRDLFGSESIDGNVLVYQVLGETEGSIEVTAEGVKKNQIHVPYTTKTAPLIKIPGFLRESDELLNDYAQLESAIRGRGIYELNKAIESYLVSTLLQTDGIHTGGASISFDNILAAKQDVKTSTGYIADAMILNPDDWTDLQKVKDENGQYILGGPAFGSYGNGNYYTAPKIWGLSVVESAEMPSGLCVVGAFKTCASVVGKANEGLRVEVSNSDQDDFVKNLITIRIEERLVEAVRVPAAFCVVGSEESSS